LDIRKVELKAESPKQKAGDEELFAFSLLLSAKSFQLFTNLAPILNKS
jgi:hypothetical protein